MFGTRELGIENDMKQGKIRNDGIGTHDNLRNDIMDHTK